MDNCHVAPISHVSRMEWGGLSCLGEEDESGSGDISAMHFELFSKSASVPQDRNDFCREIKRACSKSEIEASRRRVIDALRDVILTQQHLEKIVKVKPENRRLSKKMQFF